MSALISFGEPLICMSVVDKYARVHSFARGVCFSAATGQQAEAAKLNAAIAAYLPVRQANLKELGYGG